MLVYGVNTAVVDREDDEARVILGGAKNISRDASAGIHHEWKVRWFPIPLSDSTSIYITPLPHEPAGLSHVTADLSGQPNCDFLFPPD